VPSQDSPSPDSRSTKLASNTPAAPTARSPIPPAARPGGPATIPDGLARLNSAHVDAAEAKLLTCCGSRRWARRMAAHRPYPDLGALLAASDEAAYDLSSRDLDEAFAAESAVPLTSCDDPAARIALSAAQAEYERLFGRAFVISTSAVHEDERVSYILASLRSRLGSEVDEERAVAADELRGLARERLTRLAG
jgi:2-oxo-4-hydroxy-4-carboxy-5-ureidoimidazoline decarboxylase